MTAARVATLPTTPVRIGRTWLFADGTRLPVVAGADDDGPVTVPEDLASIEDDAELEGLESSLVAEFDRLHDEGSNDLAAMEAIADALERVRAEIGRRAEEDEQAQQRIAALRDRIHTTPAADADADADDSDDAADDTDPAATDTEPAAEPELITASGRTPAPRRPVPASASATARRAGRARVDNAPPRISITAAADLAGVGAGAVIDLTQVATSMHDKARSLSNRSPKVPIARFNLPFSTERTITERMSAEAAMEVIDNAAAPSSLVAAGGWCTPSENMYDLFALDGQTGLLDLPTVAVRRGGINLPSYIGQDAADDALWQWSEDQDELTALTITDADVATGVATISFSVPHLLDAGDLIDINVGTSLDGPRTVATVVDADTITVAAVGVTDGTNATGFATRQKGTMRIPCPTWTDYRLGGYGLTITHGNLTDQAFPELTRRYVSLAMNAHEHRMSTINIGKIRASGNTDAVTMTTIATDAFGELMSAVELQVLDYRSQYKISANVMIEVLLPTYVKGLLRADLAMRAGVDMLSITDAQIDAHFAARSVRPQYLEDYQPLYRSATAAVAWPTALEFVMYPAGNFVEGTGTTIDLGVVRDSRLNATNDFTAAWTEEFSLLARRGPKGRRVSMTLSIDGITACCA